MGPIDRRRPMINLLWGGVYMNQVGTGEFVDFCRRVGADPLIVVNFESDGRPYWAVSPKGEVRSGDAKEAAEWVDYCNTPSNAARRGLGDPCWIHERNLARGSDVTLGLVASQRIWGDTDRITPEMVTRGGLRWYKNRVVVNYDMDAKNLLRPGSRDARRRLLTMAYVASGRLLLATSFGRMDLETLRDLTRIFPFHAAPRSARPVDAFTRAIPRIYDFPVNDRWHQVTFYNPEDEKELSVGVDLSAPAAEGGLGLEPGRAYYAYDFWNDRYVGLLPGKGRMEATLRPAEARMIALHAKETVPQWIATDRHLMQGFLDLEDTAWDDAGGILSGTARVVENDPFRIVISTNGYMPSRVSAAQAGCVAELGPLEGGLLRLRIVSPETVNVRWTVFFEKRGR